MKSANTKAETSDCCGPLKIKGHEHYSSFPIIFSTPEKNPDGW